MEPCPPGKRMMIMRTLTRTDCPTIHHEAALVLAAQTLMEVAGKDTTGIHTYDDAAAAIAGLLPAELSFSAPLPIEIRSVVEECALFYTPTERNAKPKETQAALTANTITIESATERELREKSITVAGIRLWRHSEPPWTVFYCHHWVGKTFMEWSQAYESLMAATTVADVHILRQRNCERIMRAWFDATASVKTVEDLTPAQVKIFQNTVELLGEGYLLRKGIIHAHSQVATTLSYADLIERRRHDSRPADFFADLADARKAKEVPRNSLRH